ncbi:MAG: methylenetetrahydrofolate reductase [Phycisphaerae bacterium]|nr:methylenetetrahydrofolate reductase [Phycisphaerae bacterium]
MKPDSKLAQCIDSGKFFTTAEYLPGVGMDASKSSSTFSALGETAVAVNVSDNPFGVVTSSLAVSVTLDRMGVEPVYQIVTRDRNRIALQSDILGAASLGIKNVLCLSGYHQTLTACPESANVYDIDSIQLCAAVTKMCHEGVLIDGTRITQKFSMLVGAVANPYLRPMALNMMRLAKKIQAGAKFIQTQAIFDVPAFEEWLSAAHAEGLTEQTAILAGVMPLCDATEAEQLRDTFTDFRIPDAVIDRLKQASDPQKEGIALCAEIIGKIKKLDGVRGLHILSGGKEALVPDLTRAAGL